MIHVRRFLIAALVAWTAYGAYALGVAPWIEPASQVRIRAGSSVLELPLAGNVGRDFQGLFAAGSWELDQPKVVETAQCTLLLKDYKPTEDGSMEIKPCTLIFYLADKDHPRGAPVNPATDTRRPVVMRAPEGATLKFDRPLDLGRASIGRLKGGRLDGEITIHSPPSRAGANDSLELRTRNVQIDTEKAWTPNEVEFRYGRSHGRGRDLTIALLPPEKPAEGQSKSPAIGGVRALQLARVERLHLESGGSELLPSAGMFAPQLGAAGSKKDAKEPPLEIRCQGPFLLDLEHQVASFDDRVEVSRVNPIGPPDRLLCQTLTLHFSAPPAPTAPAVSNEANSLDIASRLQRIVAVGSPAILEGSSQGVFATAARMEYIVSKRRIALERGRGADQVSLSQWQNQFRAPKLEYELAEPGRLGRLWAAGPGDLNVVQGEKENRQTIAATWRKELLIRPDAANQVISLIEGASITVDPLGKFAADNLHLWVLEVAAQPAKPPAEVGALTAERSAKAEKAMIIPDRLLALGRVEIDSPQLHAQTSRLEAWFVNQPIEAELPRERREPQQPGLAVNPTPSPIGPPQMQPAAVSPPGVVPETPQQKFDVAGQTIQLQVARDGRRNAVDGLNIRGQATIKEIHTEKPGQLPLVVVGEAVELRGGATLNAQIDVVGSPAKVSARGLNLSGAAIHLHRGENRLWIDGAGTATLPLPPPRKMLEPPPPAETVEVTWQGGMTFNGQTAHLERGVVARGTTQYALADTLDVTLADRIDFAHSGGRAETKVAKLVFLGSAREPVRIESMSLDEFGKQVSLDKIVVPNLTIDRQNGSILTDGAGWVSTIRQEDGGLALAPAPIQPGRPIAEPGRPEPEKLTYLQIRFEGGIRGDLNKHEIQFHRDVAAFYRPVTGWTDEITTRPFDTMVLEDIGEDGAFLTSDTLTVLEMLIPNSRQRWVELEASGNTLVEAKQFTAQAERISYSTEKEMLVVTGDGRRDAELWKLQGALSSPFGYTAAQKFVYWRKTDSLKVEGQTVIDFQQFGGSTKPKPTRWR